MTMSKRVQKQSNEALPTAEMILKESDRGCSIFAAAILSGRMENLFRSTMHADADSRKKVIDPLFEGFGPLAGFFARIQLAYALRLIPADLRDQLDIIRRLRNDFAHDQGPIDFDDPRCAPKVSELIGPYEVEKATAAAKTGKLSTTGSNGQKVLRRLAFSIRVARLCGRLEVCALADVRTVMQLAHKRSGATTADRDQ